MPLNLAKALSRSHLTKEQKLEAERSIYGLPPVKDEAFMAQNMGAVTAQDIQAMRRIIAQYDKQNAPKEFDLNNPPKEPYVFQKYPQIVYDHDARRHASVNSDEELQQALEAGFLEHPYPANPETAEVALDVASQREVEAIDQKLKKAKKAKAAE